MIKGAIFDAGDILYFRKRNEVETLLWALEQNKLSNRQEYLDNVGIFNELKELSYRGMMSRKEAVTMFLKALGIRDESQQNSVFTSYEDEYQTNMTFPQDVPEVIKNISAMGIKLSVLSDGHCSGIEKRGWFARVGIDDKFEDVLCSCDIGYRKPEKKAYAIALERLGTDVDETVFVGHSPKDLGGAKNFGVTTIGVSCPDVNGHIVDVRLAKFLEIPEAIKKLG